MSDSQPDKVTAYLNEVYGKTEFPALAQYAGMEPLTTDVRRLIAAVEASRKYHWPEYTSWGDVCGGCWTRDGSHPVWPCPPMVDLVNALLGDA